MSDLRSPNSKPVRTVAVLTALALSSQAVQRLLEDVDYDHSAASWVPYAVGRILGIHIDWTVAVAELR